MIGPTTIRSSPGVSQVSSHVILRFRYSIFIAFTRFTARLSNSVSQDRSLESARRNWSGRTDEAASRSSTRKSSRVTIFSSNAKDSLLRKIVRYVKITTAAVSCATNKSAGYSMAFLTHSRCWSNKNSREKSGNGKRTVGFFSSKVNNCIVRISETRHPRRGSSRRASWYPKLQPQELPVK